MLNRKNKHLLRLSLSIFLVIILSAASFGEIVYLPGDEQSFYTPKSGAFTPTESLEYHPLSGNWHMVISKDDSRQVPVPGCWTGSEGAILLSTTFTLPENWESRHLRLIFWGARRQLSIKLNGRLVEAWDSDWPTLVVDLPKDLLRGDGINDLEVEVHDKLSARESIPLKSKLFDELNYAGIFSDVVLVAGPTASLESLSFKSDFTRNYGKARWELSLGIRNQKSVSPDSVVVRQITSHAEWIDKNSGRTIRSNSVTVNLGAVEISQIRLKGEINNPELWTVENPELYDFRIVFEEAGISWDIPLKLGFADIKWNSGSISMNGENLKVRGIDLRQESFENGIALSYEVIYRDLLNIKNQGFNLVRIIGGPPHPATAEICDEIGLMLIPQTGLRGVPNSIFLTSEFSDRVKKMLWSIIKRDGLHVSISAWGIGGWFSPDADVLGTLEGFANEMQQIDKRPIIAGFATKTPPVLPDGLVGLLERPPYFLFEKIQRPDFGNASWLIGGLGGFTTRINTEEDSVQGQIRQADAILHHLKAVRSSNAVGFIIDSYSDRRSALPLMITGADNNADVISRGLLNVNRENRIAWEKVGDAMGELRINTPTLDLPRSEFPIIFPISTMIVGGILLLMMRQNNVFRQNLKRVFAHTHGFFVDIRDRRYFQSGQSFMIALIFSSSQAIITSSSLHHSRFDFGLDYLLTLLFPFFQVKALLVTWAWQPIQGIIAFTLINFLLLFLVSFLIWLIGLPFKGYLQLRQTFSLVSWATSSFVLLIPIGLVHYRFLNYTWFGYLIIVLYTLFWLWYLVRIVSIIRIGYRVSNRGAWIIILLILIISTGTLWAVYRSGFALSDYLNYYKDVILPWVRA